MNLYASISLPTSLLKKKLSLIVIYIGTCTMQLHVINLSFIEFDDFFFDILLSFSKEVWRGGGGENKNKSSSTIARNIYYLNDETNK